ncbi:MAG: PIN/TRAM domain-containing protein [Planctomycetes bacterium]|nr:PIN/TRAM domain-containing protein [Planctomycetota bacterium]
MSTDAPQQPRLPAAPRTSDSDAASRANDLLHPALAGSKQRQFLLSIVRITFFALFATVTLLTIIRVDPGSPRQVQVTLSWYITIGVAAAIAALVVAVDVFTPTKKISTLFSVFFGLLGATLATAAIGFVIDLLAASYEIKAPELIGTTKVLVGIALAYLAISVVLQTQDDFRLVIPYVEFAKQLRGPRPLLLDTSALIDGRMVEVAQTGLMQSTVVVPRFVINELQVLADSADRGKRARGRRGLDMIAKLQRFTGIDVAIDETTPTGEGVDAKLVELGATTKAMLVTTDAGLRRIAEIRGVPVLFVSDLATALKPMLGPGDTVTLRLVRAGEQPGQGVGYLEDGTMVVVEDGAPMVGEVAALIVTSTMQTSAGRLLFARLATPIVEDVRSGPAQVQEPDSSSEMMSQNNEEVADGRPASQPTDLPSTPSATPERPRSPFPPVAPKSIRGSTPRNPRRG